MGVVVRAAAFAGLLPNSPWPCNKNETCRAAGPFLVEGSELLVQDLAGESNLGDSQDSEPVVSAAISQRIRTLRL